MPPDYSTEGPAAARVIQRDYPQTAMVLLSAHVEVDHAMDLPARRAQRAHDPLGVLTAREREVLALMTEGRSNAGIGQVWWVTKGTVEKHVRSILMKLQLPEIAEVHRRVLAVLAFLDAR